MIAEYGGVEAARDFQVVSDKGKSKYRYDFKKVSILSPKSGKVYKVPMVEGLPFLSFIYYHHYII